MMRIIFGIIVLITITYLLWEMYKNISTIDKMKRKELLKNPSYLFGTGLFYLGTLCILLNFVFQSDWMRNIGTYAVCTSLFFAGVIHSKKSKIDGYSLIVLSIGLASFYYFLTS